MALKGKYDYKGIEVADAYVKIASVNWNCSSNLTDGYKLQLEIGTQMFIKIKQLGMQILIVISAQLAEHLTWT